MTNFELEMKIDQIANYCFLSKYNDSYISVVKIIPEELILTGNKFLLGKLIDNIWKSWEKTKNLIKDEIINDGCVWDNERQELIELCQK